MKASRFKKAGHKMRKGEHMKVLILGGAGGMAYAAMKDLLEVDTEESSQIVAADKNQDKVAQVARGFGSGKLRPASIDIAEHSKLVEMMKGFDVVVNSTVTAGSIPVAVLRAALEARVNVLDLGAWPEETRQCLALDDAFKEAGLTAILGFGSSPGTTNLMAKSLVDRLDTVETIEISFAYARVGTSTVPLKVPFLGALTEFTAEPEVFREGSFIKLPPQSGLEDIQYPEPIGIRRSFFIGHPEIATFPESFRDKGIKNVSMKAGFNPDFAEKVNFLIGLGIISEETIKVGDTTVVPLDVLSACLAKLPPEEGEVKDYGCTRVIARGERAGESLEYTALLFNHPQKGLTGTQLRTGIPLSVGVRMLGRGEISRKGVFPPETAVAPKPFFKEIARRGLEIALTSRTFL